MHRNDCPACHPERNGVKSKDLRICKSVRTIDVCTNLPVRRSFDALALAQDDIEWEIVPLFGAWRTTESHFRTTIVYIKIKALPQAEYLITLPGNG